MLDLTTDQWIVIAVIFLAGWLLGLLTARGSGGGRWKEQYETERDAHIRLRREYDQHLSSHRELSATDRDRLAAHRH